MFHGKVAHVRAYVVCMCVCVCTVSEGCVSPVKTTLNKEVGEAVRVCEKCRECKNDSVMLNPYQKAAVVSL